MLGSGAIVVMDETTDMVQACVASCGSSPTSRAASARRAARARLARADPLPHHSTATAARATSTCCWTSATTSVPASRGRRKQTTICPLGPSAVSPIASRSSASATSSRPTSRRARWRARRRSPSPPERHRPAWPAVVGHDRHRPRPTPATPSRRRHRHGQRRRPSSPSKGELVIDAAERHGVYIPRFCYHQRMKPVGHVPHVPRRGRHRSRPGAAAGVHARVHRGHEGRHRVRRDQEGPGRRARVPAHQPPARLPGVRQGRRVPAAGPDARVRPGRVALRRGEAPLREADPDQRPRLPRPRALHPVRPLHALRQGGRRRPADPLHRPRQPDRGQHLPRRAVRLVLQRQHRADLPGRRAHRPSRTASRPARGTSTQVESTCTSCSVGCRIAVQSSRERGRCATSASTSTRSTGAGCATRAASASRRSTATTACADPLRPRGRRRRTPRRRWSEALDAAADGPSAAASTPAGRRRSPCSAAPACTNEDAYAWAKLAKGVIGTDNVDASSATACPPRWCSACPGPRSTRRARAGGTVILLGPDLKEELPVLYLRLRHAVVEDGVTLVELSPRLTGSTELDRRVIAAATARARSPRSLRALLDGDAGRRRRRRRRRRRWPARARCCGRRCPSRSCSAGRRWPSRPTPSSTPPACSLDGLPDVRFLSALRRGNVHGALDMGLAPGFLPGRVTLDDGRAWFADGGPRCPRQRASTRPGSSRPPPTAASTRSCCSGADPLADFPDRDLARRALDGAGAVIAVDLFLTDVGRRRPTSCCPPPASPRRPGTDDEPRGPRQPAQPAGHAAGHGPGRLDHRRRARRALGADLGLESVEQIWDEIAALAPAYRGRRRRAARRASTAATASSCRCRPTAPSRSDVDDAAAEPRPTRCDAEAADGDEPPAIAVTLEPPAAARVARVAGAPAGGARRSTATRCGSSPAASSTTTASSCSTRRRWPRWRRARVLRSTPTTSTASASPTATGCGSRRPRRRSTLESSPTTGVPAGLGRVAFNQPGAPRRRPHRRARAGHRPPHRDRPTVTSLTVRCRSRCSLDGVDLARRAHRHRQGRRRLRAAARRGDAHDLVRAQGHRRHAEPHRPEPGRARGASCRRSPTASSSSSRKT